METAAESLHEREIKREFFREWDKVTTRERVGSRSKVPGKMGNKSWSVPGHQEQSCSSNTDSHVNCSYLLVSGVFCSSYKHTYFGLSGILGIG